MGKYCTVQRAGSVKPWPQADHLHPRALGWFPLPSSPLFLTNPIPPLPLAARLGGKKKSWFNFGRAAAKVPGDTLGTGVEEGGRIIGGSSSTAAAERAPLFSGSRSDEPGRQGGGLLASLVKNK
jgi:hypothetical protein